MIIHGLGVEVDSKILSLLCSEGGGACMDTPTEDILVIVINVGYNYY